MAKIATSYDLVVRNLIAARTRITADADTPVVNYALLHDGEPYGAGTMTWNGYDYTDAWVARFLLPNTPGVLKAIITAAVVVDGESVAGRLDPTSLLVTS